jgi:hypothetical protein
VRPAAVALKKAEKSFTSATTVDVGGAARMATKERNALDVRRASSTTDWFLTDFT